jgi:hypothetical protein
MFTDPGPIPFFFNSLYRPLPYRHMKKMFPSVEFLLDDF